ncbi:MAG: hypothetical protein JOZ69_24955 [Myxococcales bacterium]|nr:hypothetical protein [Myxococcales bacterium]
MKTLLPVDEDDGLLRRPEAGETAVQDPTQLALRNAALERLAREQRELAAFLVHDLKNPLASLSSNLEYARQALGPGSPILGADWPTSFIVRIPIVPQAA